MSINPLVSFFNTLGSIVIKYLNVVGVGFKFLLTIFLKKPSIKGLQLFIEQLYKHAVLGLPLIFVSSIFIGMVLALQGYNTLSKFGSSSELGVLVALSVVRELGPVITAILFIARSGSAMTAEVSLMKTTEQLTCIDMLGINPINLIISPRFFASCFAILLLTILFDAIAIYGGYLIGVIWFGIDAGSFFGSMQASINFYTDIVTGLIKSFVFGFGISWIVLFQGYNSVPNASGAAKATTRAVVYSALLVFWLDFVLTSLMTGG